MACSIGLCERRKSDHSLATATARNQRLSTMRELEYMNWRDHPLSIRRRRYAVAMAVGKLKRSSWVCDTPGTTERRQLGSAARLLDGAAQIDLSR